MARIVSGIEENAHDRRDQSLQRVLVAEHRQFGAAPIQPIPGVPTTSFNGHAGEVMASPRVFAIYWGRDYGSPASGLNAVAHALDAFFSTVLPGRYIQELSRYNVGAATFAGSTWVDHDSSTPQTFTIDDMARILNSWLDAGMAQAPAYFETDLLFVIIAPSEVTLVDNNGGGGFCAYHSSAKHNRFWGKDNLFFAVCDAPGNTETIAHELVEAFTDRSHNGWFSDDGPEIGDVCNSCGSSALTIDGFSVASYWLVNDGRCLQQADLTPPAVKQIRVTVSPAYLGLQYNKNPKTVHITFHAVDAQTGVVVPSAVELDDPVGGVTALRTDAPTNVALSAIREFDPETRRWLTARPDATVIPDDATYPRRTLTL